MSAVQSFGSGVIGIILVLHMLDVLATSVESRGDGLVSTAVAMDSGLGGTRGG